MLAMQDTAETKYNLLLSISYKLGNICKKYTSLLS